MRDWRNAFTVSTSFGRYSFPGQCYKHNSVGITAGCVISSGRAFRETLDKVLTQYRGARVELDDRGMKLRYSPPPVKGRTAIVLPKR